MVLLVDRSTTCPGKLREALVIARKVVAVFPFAVPVVVPSRGLPWMNTGAGRGERSPEARREPCEVCALAGAKGMPLRAPGEVAGVVAADNGW